MTIILADGRIADMDCDCPYAAEGNYCKHEAAVLYALTDEAEGPDAGAYEVKETDAEYVDNWHAQNDEPKEKLSWLSKLEAERGTEAVHFIYV